MKCFNCGNETSEYICDNCIQEETLNNIFEQLLLTKSDNCNNPYILEYASNLESFKDIRNCIPTILDKFEKTINEYYYCRYYKRTFNKSYEEKAINYLNTHKGFDIKKQNILYELLNYYLREDYEKPQKWCDIIANNFELCIELYDISSKHLSMIGEYEVAENLIKTGMRNLDKKELYLFSNKDNMEKSFTETTRLIERYKSGKPYWPATEERRKQIKRIYEEKGIEIPTSSKHISTHNRENRRVKASDFISNNDWYDDIPSDYISFYCKGIYSTKTIITMYEIGAVKVSNGLITEKFSTIICPWEDTKTKIGAANELGITVNELENADNIETALKRFFDFAGGKLLVSTEGLGVQKSILTRAMRYAFYKELINPIGDILDYAANKDSRFDFENNTREYLINYFNLKEEKDSLSKAISNYKIIEELRKL